MGLRLLLSRLSSTHTRASAGRALAVLCAFGFLATLFVLAASGGLARWFFALLVWALFIYVPLRILLEAGGTLAPAVRRRLAVETAGDPRGLTSGAGIELAVDRLVEQEIVMPRIATPAEREKAREGAIAILIALRRTPRELPAATGAALGCLDRWVSGIGPWAQREAGQNIQARWREVRALAAMAAMTKVLVAADDTHAGSSQGRRDPPGGDPAGFLDACLDYCDDLALDVDVASWEEPALGIRISAARADDIRDAWRTFAETGAPALDARNAFINVLLQPSQTP